MKLLIDKMVDELDYEAYGEQWENPAAEFFHTWRIGTGAKPFGKVDHNNDADKKNG